jgi:hypothetical protein
MLHRFAAALDSIPGPFHLLAVAQRDVLACPPEALLPPIFDHLMHA